MRDHSGEDELLTLCRGAIAAEGRALLAAAEALGPEMVAALEHLHAAADPLVVSGIGKSGHVGRKIASTFSSVGKPALFVQASEASHGDLGLVGQRSAALILSNSGETPELSDLIHYCQLHSIPIVAITARADSTLGRAATVTLAYGVVEEVCLIGLAPTTSTTVQIALGDALAVGLTRMMGTVPDDFRRYHPGGKLGARIARVERIMHTGDALPIVPPDMAMAEVVVEITRKALGLAIISSDGVAVEGIITDGDMRRAADRLWQSRARDVGSAHPVTVTPETLVADALALMTERGITACIVAREGRLAGLVHVHDCLRLGVLA